MSPPFRITVLEPLPDRIRELRAELWEGEYGIETATSSLARAVAERLEKVADER